MILDEWTLMIQHTKMNTPFDTTFDDEIFQKDGSTEIFNVQKI